MSDPTSLERDMRALRTIATPRDLAANVLLATGLADRFAAIATPLGAMFIAWNDAGVSLVRPAKSGAAFVRLLHDELGRRGIAAELPRDLADRLARRFAGDTRTAIPLDLRTRSPFERAVLERAAMIPRGSVKPYAWIAAQIGNPRAVRAVGTALGKNPVPLIIPCHRVVPAGGGIGSYIFGAASKAALLEREGVAL